jgi:electron transfer flavoprotein beta subunit
MVNVLVCVKRVPGTSGEILLTPDGMSVDARYVGYMLSPHEECAVELAIQVASATDGIATVLSLGSDDSIEQMRDALAVGCKAGVLIEADAAAYGPGDVAAAIAEVVRAHQAAGNTYDLILTGNDAADTGDFQVPIRLAYALDRPVLTGLSKVSVAGDRPGRRPLGHRGVRGPAARRDRRSGRGRRTALPLHPGADEGQEGAGGTGHAVVDTDRQRSDVDGVAAAATERRGETR